MHGTYPFDRPVVILAAPRSGSTLLFETLTKSSDFWTIGGESHGIFESVQRFSPMMGHCDSNALFAEDATPEIVEHIRGQFLQRLHDINGRGFRNMREVMDTRPRLLEKTPKNALRTSLMNEIFPDALFVYLYRNPRENISSMIDAWQSGRFVTYPELPGRNRPWSLLLPPGWQSYHDASLELITAFQWQAANNAILSELKKLGDDRWIAVSHGQQVNSAAETAQRICDFCDVSADAILASLSKEKPKLSRYTLTLPAAGKWRKRAAALGSVMPLLRDTVEFIRESTDGLPEDEFDLSTDAAPGGSSPPAQGGPGIRVNSAPG
jgi:hypothetical protein